MLVNSNIDRLHNAVIDWTNQNILQAQIIQVEQLLVTFPEFVAFLVRFVFFQTLVYGQYFAIIYLSFFPLTFDHCITCPYSF